MLAARFRMESNAAVKEYQHPIAHGRVPRASPLDPVRGPQGDRSWTLTAWQRMPKAGLSQLSAGHEVSHAPTRTM